MTGPKLPTEFCCMKLIWPVLVSMCTEDIILLRPQIKKYFPEDITRKSGAFLLFIAAAICPNLFSLC